MIKEVTRKSMKIRYSGRSSDYITPSFGYGCLYKCAYCYMRRNVPKGVSIAKNVGDILDVVDIHCRETANAMKPNQTHDSLITYDIGCNEDIALHAKYYPMESIFKRTTDKMFTFATKTAGSDYLPEVTEDQNVRIRFSLMPQPYSDILEPNTASVKERLDAVKEYQNMGYEVHLNFSPVIITEGWTNTYIDLFQKVNDYQFENVKSEVIFLTHSVKMHEYNMKHNPEAEALLWRPDLQESKVTSYGGKALRYKWQLKNKAIMHFKEHYKEYLKNIPIRYIF